MLLCLAFLGVTNALALLRLLPMSDRDKDAEILVLRHQVAALQWQLHGERARFTPADRAWLAAVLHRLPRAGLRDLRLLVRPETVLRWHRDLIARQQVRISRPRRSGRPRTVRRLHLCSGGHRTRRPPGPDPLRHRPPDRRLGRPRPPGTWRWTSKTPDVR